MATAPTIEQFEVRNRWTNRVQFTAEITCAPDASIGARRHEAACRAGVGMTHPMPKAATTARLDACRIAPLTEAGRRMIEKYLVHKATVEASKTLRPIYTGRDGRIFMTLSPGSGSEASTVRKLIRDGYAEGTYNWGNQSRWMIPTEKGLRAAAEQVAK